MEFLNLVLGVPLGYLMKACYLICKDYGLSILLFTLATKIILFPLSLLSQKNSIKMVKMQPMLDDIKHRYEGNSELIMQEQRKLYKEEKYSTFAGILPLLLQIPLILGLINVIYNPLQHLLNLDPSTIEVLIIKTRELTGIQELGTGAQLTVMEMVKASPDAFASLSRIGDVIPRILSMDMTFLGINLSALPSIGAITILVPIFSGLSALLLSLVQNKVNVLQREQGLIGKWGMAIFLVAFSTYFAFIVPNGIGVYWIVGNILSVLVTLVCNMIYDPKKYIDYENRSQKSKLTREERIVQKEKKKVARARERRDSHRFFSCKKKLVFYSESSGFYKYFERLIDYILANSDLTVHYVTSDMNDQIFKNTDTRIEKYYIGPQALIAFMMKLDADMVVMTMPDLDKYHIKRSIVKKDVEYIYMDHGMGSFHLMLREGALDHFDTIFCYGPNHIDEVRQTEEVYRLPKKNLVDVGFPLLDTLLENVKDLVEEVREKKRILIAPSWQKDNLVEYCLDEIFEQLLHRGYEIILRPHPEFIKRFPAKMKAIQTKYEKDIGDDFVIETDFSSNFTVYSSDLVITDWSSIANEFSYATKRPSLFINTPMKIMNPNYKMIPAEPLEITLRDKLGLSVDTDKLDTLAEKVDYLLTRREEYRHIITETMETSMFNIGQSARAGGEYIIQTIYEKGKIREHEENEYQKLLEELNISK